jgi:general secretion pathway protein H
LLEILLVLGLMGLLVGVLIVGAVRLVGDQPVTPEDVFWKAVTETRKQALISGKEVRLRFVSKSVKDQDRALVASSANGSTSFPFKPEAELTVDFLSLQKGTSSVLIGGQLMETQTMPFVTFYGDGTCTPFRVQIRTGGAARSIAIDPWTCAPVLAANDNPR